ncbi:Uncharacterized protein dnm_050140 [Desulfonema magnum]|uniref:Uncharacterized protein n=1 Tax=Desulfonema magnum TaxID=45655 RepID=A0A975BPH6_9BACT|nr:Uncharacterized protein dnm_050140 [Desulfonema magnum]
MNSFARRHGFRRKQNVFRKRGERDDTVSEKKTGITGEDKLSQSRDIEKAKQLLNELE